MMITLIVKINKEQEQREKREVVEYYNYYLDGMLSSPEYDRFWELLYNFSFFFLRNIHMGVDNREDIWQDFIMDLLTMNSNYKHVDDFNQLTKLIDYKLKKIMYHYKTDKDLK